MLHLMVHQVTSKLVILISELYGGEESDLRLGCLTPEVGAPQYPLGYGAGRASDPVRTFWSTSSRSVTNGIIMQVKAQQFIM